MGSPALNFGVYLAVCVGLPGLPAAVAAVWRRCADRRACRTDHPSLPPLEEVAADLHRLLRCSRELPAGSPYLRHRAVELAYDDVLMLACKELEVANELDELPPGWERDVERLRVEACLENAGLALRRER